LNEAMKQRLVGAIIIGCLAIIFIPLVLDGEGLAPPELETNIPARPPIPERITTEAVRPLPGLVTERISVAPEIDLQTPVTSPEDNMESNVAEIPQENPVPATIVSSQNPRFNAEGVPESWSVRLASFAEAANAENLVRRLLAEDYRAYSASIDSSRGSLTAVFVGPVLSRSEAGALQRELVEKFDLNGMVVEFAISETPQ